MSTQAELCRPTLFTSSWSPWLSGDHLIPSLNLAAVEMEWLIPASFRLVTKHHTHI